MTLVATDQPSATTDRLSWWRLVRSNRVVQSAFALIALQMVFRCWVIYAAWFHIDDFNFISRMINSGTGPSNAFRPYFGHVMPAAMYLSWLNNVVAPWNWALPASELLVLQLLADIGLLFLLVRLFGPRAGILPPLVVFLFSAISIPATIWWAAAINALPLLISLFFGLSAHVAYLRYRRLRHAISANAWIVAGLAFNEKTVLVYGALGVFTLCYFSSGTGVSRVTGAVRKYQAGIIVYAVTAAAYCALYVHLGLDFDYGTRHGYPTGEVIKNMALRGYVPGVFGGPLTWLSYKGQPASVPQPGDLVVAISILAFALLGRELFLARSGWVRAIWLPTFFLTADVVLVVTGRASFVGALISLDYRFQGELPGVTAIALGCALLPILGAQHQVTARNRSELFDHPGRVALVCVVISALGVYSSSVYAKHWHADHGAERYFRQLLPTLASAQRPVAVVDAPVPPSVTHGFFYPENAISHLFRDYRDALRFPTTATDTLKMIDTSGTLAPAVIPPVRSAPPGPRKGCGYRVSDKSVKIPLDGPLAFGGWWVRIGYISNAASPVSITTHDVTRRTAVAPGLHALYVKGAGAFDSVTISGLQGDAVLCTNDVTVGRPVPGGKAQG